MQDSSTGEFKPIPDEFLKDIPQDSPGKMAELLALNQKLKDAVIANRSHQGPIFAVGEVLEIRGSKFKIHAIYGTRITLESIVTPL